MLFVVNLHKNTSMPTRAYFTHALFTSNVSCLLLPPLIFTHLYTLPNFSYVVSPCTSPRHFASEDHPDHLVPTAWKVQNGTNIPVRQALAWLIKFTWGSLRKADALLKFLLIFTHILMTE